MSIKITEKMLSIPPYLSTSWSHITALHIKGGVLAITLADGDTVNIPNLSRDTLDTIFQHHALHLEKDLPPVESRMKSLEEPPIRFAFGTTIEGFGNMMQHNPNQADAPDLPPEVVQKITAISKIIAPPEEQMATPKAEPNCNCFYCQIARALKPESDEQIEHEVLPEDLHFQEWTITQIGDKLFSVVNRLDENEKYQVYLGEPIGCTCGKTGCEHILAVLKS